MGRCLVVAVVLATGCASQLAPLAVRTVSQVDDVPGVDQGDAYARALVWFESSHDRAALRVTSKDPTTATIAASGEMQCHSSVGSGLRAMGLGFNQNYLRFNMVFQARAGRVKIAFSELFYFIKDVRYESSSLTQGPANKEEVDTLHRECLKPLEDSLMQAVRAPASSAF